MIHLSIYLFINHHLKPTASRPLNKNKSPPHHRIQTRHPAHLHDAYFLSISCPYSIWTGSSYNVPEPDVGRDPDPLGPASDVDRAEDDGSGGGCIRPGAWDLGGGSVESDDLGGVNSRTRAKYFPSGRINSLRRSMEVLLRGASSNLSSGMKSVDGKLTCSFGACAFCCPTAPFWTVVLSTCRPLPLPLYVFVSDILFSIEMF